MVKTEIAFIRGPRRVNPDRSRLERFTAAIIFNQQSQIVWPATHGELKPVIPKEELPAFRLSAVEAEKYRHESQQNEQTR
jgi:hypothetical protein